MTCELCNPKTVGYTIYFSNEQRMDLLVKYFTDYPKTTWQKLNERMFWALEPVLFDLMDYVQTHMDAEAIYAVKADKEDPMRDLNKLKPIKSFQSEREASWIDAIIQKKSIRTHYQPIVKMLDHEVHIVGNELLSRGIDDQGQLIAPFHLFEAARKRNRLFALDRLCRLESIKNAAPVADRLIFINFIPTSIYVPEHCLATTFAAIQRAGIRPEHVVFEVVETDKVDDMAHLLSILDYYRTHGVKYALDDVGTGFNDLELLARMQPDFVKLAREFADGVSVDAEKQKVARNVMRLAHKVGALALAEGIEQASDLRYLQEMGYDLFQGYLFGKPDATPIKQVHAIQ
ncbi:EAL domain-containing protein [Sporosarcina sp. ITBMC105]